MNLPIPPNSPSQKLIAIDEICERFEDDLRSGSPPRMEDFLPGEWVEEDRARLLEYLLRIEVEYRANRGEPVSRDDYLPRFADQSETVDGILRELTAAKGPKTIGPYRIVGKLGAGGMGAVYKAFQPRLNRFVAIKVLPAALLSDPAAQRRFDREMQAVGKVAHPNLITAFDAGHADDSHYLVMELVEGFNLAEISRRRGQLDVANACEMIRQASLGLAEVHRSGFIHRDIKPGNLMLGASGQVKVLDLGLALLHERPTLDDDPELTNAGQMMGTLDYMAPEQCVDSHRVDPRADIYALGATLFRLLTGRVPFSHRESMTSVARLSAKLQETCPPLIRFRSDLPAPLSALVEQMLARAPEDRPATAEEVVRRLAPYCSGANLMRLFEETGSSAALEPASDTATGGPTIQNSPQKEDPPHARGMGIWTWIVGLAALVILLGVVIYLPAKNGTIRVEILDPEIMATISGEKLTLQKKDWDRTISLSPGERTLLIERGDFRFETKSFELRAGETVTLRIELLDGKVVVRDDRQEIGSRAIPLAAATPVDPPKRKPHPAVRAQPNPQSSEYDIAKYLRRIGAHVSTNTGNETDTNLKITAIIWVQGDDVVDGNLAPLSGLRHVEQLSLKSQRVTSEGLACFRNCVALKRLDLAYAGIEAEGAELLAGFPALEYLQPPCVDSQAWIAAAAKCPKVNSLHLYRCDIPDDGLKPLIGMKQLKWLAIMECRKLTPAAISHLEQLKPLETLVIGKCPPLEDDPALIARLRLALPGAKVNP